MPIMSPSYPVKTTLLVLLMVAAAMPVSAKSDVIADGYGYVEGPVFRGADLFFVDYNSSQVLRVHAGVTTRFWQQAGCGANGLLWRESELLVACYDDGTIVELSADGEILQTITKDEDNQSFEAPNDLAGDEHGGVYFSTSGNGTQSPGKVFYLSSSGRVVDVANGVLDSNGLVTSLDGRMLYVAESATHRLLAYNIDDDGSLSGRRTVADFDKLLATSGGSSHVPDGVRMDREGRLFIGLFDGAGFVVLDQAGHLLKSVSLPGQHHASLAISPDGREIYATVVSKDIFGDVRGEIIRVANPMAH